MYISDVRTCNKRFGLFTSESMHQMLQAVPTALFIQHLLLCLLSLQENGNSDSEIDSCAYR